MLFSWWTPEWFALCTDGDVDLKVVSTFGHDNDSSSTFYPSESVVTLAG